MSELQVGSILAGIAEGLTKLSETVRVVGEPVQAGDKIIIPAVVARAGFGAGGGSGQQEGAKSEGGGGGGGGGLMLTPVFLIVDAEGERLITVPSTPGISSVVDKIKQVAESFKCPKPSKDQADGE